LRCSRHLLTSGRVQAFPTQEYACFTAAFTFIQLAQYAQFVLCRMLASFGFGDHLGFRDFYFLRAVLPWIHGFSPAHY
jgi:hypothetical protein